MKKRGMKLVQAEKRGIAREERENKRHYGKFFSENEFADVSGYGVCSYGACNDACTDGD